MAGAAPEVVGGHRRRRIHRRCMRHARRTRASVDQWAETGGSGGDDRRRSGQGDPGPAGIPQRCRPELPDVVARGQDAVRRRGPAHQACHADRLRSGRRHVRARRAIDRTAPARQRASHRDAAPSARPRQHADCRRTRPGNHREGGLGGRHRPRCRRARRRGDLLRSGEAPHRAPGPSPAITSPADGASKCRPCGASRMPRSAFAWWGQGRTI